MNELIIYPGAIANGSAPMSLSAFCKRYLQARQTSPMYAGNLQRRAEALEDFAGSLDIRQVLTTPVLTSFLKSLTGRKPHTLKSFRGDLLTLWNAAADENLVPYPNTRRIWKPKVPALQIDCYSLEEVETLLGAAAKLKRGLANGIAKRLYWSAIIRAAWDSGLRRGDLWAFQMEVIRPDGSFRLTMSKTGKPIKRKFSKPTLAAMRAIGRPQPFAWPHAGWTFGEQFRQLVKASGVGRGSFRWLRRACGSHIDAAHPGAGSKVLGHADPTMFAKHYDAQLEGEVLMPPELSCGDADADGGAFDEFAFL